MVSRGRPTTFRVAFQNKCTGYLGQSKSIQVAVISLAGTCAEPQLDAGRAATSVADAALREMRQISIPLMFSVASKAGPVLYDLLQGAERSLAIAGAIGHSGRESATRIPQGVP